MYIVRHAEVLSEDLYCTAITCERHLVKVKDSRGEDERKGVEVTSTHEEELPGSRGTANFALRWHKDSKMAAHLNVHEIEKEVKTKAKDVLRSAYTAEDEGKFIGIVGFDCRGMDVTDWQPQVGHLSVAHQCTQALDAPYNASCMQVWPHRGRRHNATAEGVFLGLISTAFLSPRLLTRPACTPPDQLCQFRMASRSRVRAGQFLRMWTCRRRSGWTMMRSWGSRSASTTSSGSSQQ